jgi:hypothetical protein
MCPLLAQFIIGFFLLRPFTVLMKQTRQAVRAVKQSIFLDIYGSETVWVDSGNTKGGSITIPLISCLTVLDESVLQIKTTIFSCHTADSKLVKQEVNGIVILPPLVFLGCRASRDQNSGSPNFGAKFENWLKKRER